MEAAIRQLVWTVAMTLPGLGAGCATGCITHRYNQAAHDATIIEYVPLPHHVPSHRGGASFRFAMAHDVIHERFPRHGPVYFRERDRLTRAKLAKLAPDDPARFPLMDDLGAGLHRLGRSNEAIAMLRSKLARQQAMNYAGRILYTSYANLGTFLVHANFDKAAAGDAEARERFREGVGLIRKSVEVNPGAHFGREKWQAAIPEFHLAAMEKPELLKTFDCLGNRLDLGIEKMMNGPSNEYGRATRSSQLLFDTLARVRIDSSLDELPLWEIRMPVTRVGAEIGWKASKVPSHRTPVHFDEPMLGIIDMWRQGGGANPHFALAIGETMLRVGQRHIAWTAYERAARMTEQFWAAPAVQQFLHDHCRKRQEQIETVLATTHPSAERETMASLRTRYDEELAYGQDYQRVYERYEAEKIAAGVPITGERFFDAFHEGREPIASAIGPEEWLGGVTRERANEYEIRWTLSWGIFGAGLSAMIFALVTRWRRMKARRAVSPTRRRSDR